MEKSAQDAYPHQLAVGAQYQRLRVGLGGVDTAVGLPTWDFQPTDEEAKAALAPPPAPPRRVQGFGGLSFADLCAIEATAGRARLDGCEDHQSDP